MFFCFTSNAHMSEEGNYTTRVRLTEFEIRRRDGCASDGSGIDDVKYVEVYGVSTEAQCEYAPCSPSARFVPFSMTMRSDDPRGTRVLLFRF